MRIADLSKLIPEAAERKAWGDDVVTSAVRRLIRRPLLEGKSVALLSRRENPPYYIPALTKKKPGAWPVSLRELWTRGLSDYDASRVTMSTVHSFKGLEADFVIILDAVKKSFPLVHPDWVFMRAFGDSVERLVEDERRLFYVASTRPIETLVFLMEDEAVSEFLSPIQAKVPKIIWADYPAFVECAEGWVVKIGCCEWAGTSPSFERKDRLKANSFAFRGGEWPHWTREFAGELTLLQLVSEMHSASWVKGPDGLEVKVCQLDGNVVACYEIIQNSWRETSLRVKGLPDADDGFDGTA